MEYLHTAIFHSMRFQTIPFYLFRFVTCSIVKTNKLKTVNIPAMALATSVLSMFAIANNPTINSTFVVLTNLFTPLSLIVL